MTGMTSKIETKAFHAGSTRRNDCIIVPHKPAKKNRKTNWTIAAPKREADAFAADQIRKKKTPARRPPLRIAPL